MEYPNIKPFLLPVEMRRNMETMPTLLLQATLTDGLLDVTILEPFTVLDVPVLAFQLFNKTIDQNSRTRLSDVGGCVFVGLLPEWCILTEILWRRTLMWISG